MAAASSSSSSSSVRSSSSSTASAAAGHTNGSGSTSGRSERQTTSSAQVPPTHSTRQTTSSSQANSHRSRPSSSSSRRSVTPNSRTPHSNPEYQQEAGRVRVAVRLRPRNLEDRISDSDFADGVELQPELKRLKLRKNNWSSESYRFDEVFTETASQNRVYQVVAKPVVESVLSGYNGTVMAYGQTGTGKTYTLGSLGRDDASERGIMVRALEDILSTSSDSVEVSYLQLYMESIQDLLAPEKINIPIHEDPKTGEVSLPGASVVRIKDLDHFLQLLQIGEANRHAANTKLNTESSRSHAILMVFVRRSVQENGTDEIASQEKASIADLSVRHGAPIVRKSKLLIVDLAGSERIDKSGSEGHLLEEAKFINLSLTSLGKCINALAENSPHIPIRDSKLTRLLRDSFGGSARTSLIVTIGPSARHYAETTSTIMFGQRAMRIVNMVKLKEEFDYESLCRKLENQVDHLTAQFERQQKLLDSNKLELEGQLKECQDSFAEAKTNLSTRSQLLEKENARLELDLKDLLDELNRQKEQSDLMHDKVAQLEASLEHRELESSMYQKILADTTQMYEEKIAKLIKELDDERARAESIEKQLDETMKLLTDGQKAIQQHQTKNSAYQSALADTTQMYEKKIAELMDQLENEHARFEDLEEQLDVEKKQCNRQNSMQGKKEIDELRVQLEEMNQLHEQTLNKYWSLKSEYTDLSEEKARLKEELQDAKQRLLIEEKQRKSVENELIKLKKAALEKEDEFEDKKSYMKENIHKGSSAFGNPMGLHNSNPSRDSISGQRATIAKICEEVGLQKILQLLTSEDIDVQTHAVKVVANLAAEDANQAKIVEEGGLDALLALLRSSQNTTILRVASGAIANLAMNEVNQGLIMSRGGAQLLAETASNTNDPQTLRMVAGALANLCGNERIHTMLKEDGGIKALLGMAKSGSSEVIAQVARGLANFAKCESRGTIQGHRKGRSLLMDDGVLTWLIINSNTMSTSTQRHIELALCHLAQNEDNARDFMSSGGLQEIIRISAESSRDDIRNLAKKALRVNPKFYNQMHGE
ncbi:armadillo repeat-containing kinesin-like protein 1 [Pyrus ussuriensis x Pyrus communis]|uniref:Armadillo repeat-containing kinesin-like protein 1 n=1 Tax=Pyrus ussuriensis x Pyrus communis TaxID=2448454 RepID=A0A5N5F425_9ROSA|nr:armadillo repeat-containing kinesin-like protein 1 [Pyrus ussuriensis x Pyrus communis]